MYQNNLLKEHLSIKVSYYCNDKNKENIIFLENWEEFFYLIFLLSIKKRTNFFYYRPPYLSIGLLSTNSSLIYYRTPKEGRFSFSSFLDNQKIIEGYYLENLNKINHFEMVNDFFLETIISKKIDYKIETIKFEIMSFDFQPIKDEKILEIYRFFANGYFSQENRIIQKPKSVGKNYYRNSSIFRRKMNTLQEMKEAEKTLDIEKEENIKINFRNRDLPTAWDDIRYFNHKDKNWKKFRKTKYKIKPVFQN